jgi:hypothetical protein
MRTITANPGTRVGRHGTVPPSQAGRAPANEIRAAARVRDSPYRGGDRRSGIEESSGSFVKLNNARGGGGSRAFLLLQPTGVN